MSRSFQLKHQVCLFWGEGRMESGQRGRGQGMKGLGCPGQHCGLHPKGEGKS